MWLLDTVALSETFKRRPNPGFVDWLGAHGGNTIHTSVLCLGEIRRGVERLTADDRRAAMRLWLEVDLSDWLGNRVIGIDGITAQVWGRIGAMRTVPPIDSLIAASAIIHNLTLVTRNVRDFDGLGVPVVNPWT